ncbi:hypothetical protein FEM48_Zijuj07G0040000 [Ziziphus jujuba var. spinosa]|uniref:PPM-type phosphatase domain-containing protein n=1 Tax=Ziziphus jujuba var. spinosa TaxID=714518 RepID=A0A978V2B6_ZIZJJ|nr:hypothetical protein FEM48_Zijuj07G0040000 [Ziziphus jujuba var. spinosa]
MGSCFSMDGSTAISYTQASSSSSSKKKNSYRRKNRMGALSSSTNSPPSSSCATVDSKMEIWLHRVPGRFCLNGSTDEASLFTKQGKKGVNQDAMIVWENFGSKPDTTFCGVFDGHGLNGHLIAKKVRDSLPLKVSSQWELSSSIRDGQSDVKSDAMGSLNSKVTAVMPGLEYGTKHTEMLMTLKDSFLKAFKAMDKELKLHPRMDCYCSGTTAVTLVKQGQDLIVANTGDSRAVLGEAERIRLSKGRVFALQNEPEIARVWLPNINSPGLAMSRAFGDFCLKDFGLISVPDITYHRITEKDEFVVLATDGIWDVLSNNEVVNIVASSTRSRAAQALVESAIRAWRHKFPSAKVDDCAVVCLFLNSVSKKTCEGEESNVRSS